MTRNQFTEEQEQWLQALESGTWRQQEKVLFNPKTNAYCCLGVATKLWNPDGAPKCWIIKEYPDDFWEEDELNEGEVSIGDEGETARPEVVRSLFLRGSEGQISYAAPPLDGWPSLILANDNGVTFAEIAAYIRRYPWAVFTNFSSPKASAE